MRTDGTGQPSAGAPRRGASQVPGAGLRQERTPGSSLIPLLLLLLSLFDLRVEIVLLIDHFTLTSLVQALTAHPLAVAVLLLQGSLWRHYRR